MANFFTELIEKTELEELNANSNGEYLPTKEGFSKVTVAVPIPQLVAPTLSIADNTLTITDTSNGAFATSYDLYIDGSLSGNYTSTTIDLTTLGLAAGTYSITAIAKGTNFVDSEASEAVSYEVAAEDALAGTWVFNDVLNLNDLLRVDLEFTSNGEDFITLFVTPPEVSGSASNKVRYKSTNSVTRNVYSVGEWEDSAYKTIEISTLYADIVVNQGDGEPSEFLTWLQSNATKQ